QGSILLNEPAIHLHLPHLCMLFAQRLRQIHNSPIHFLSCPVKTAFTSIQALYSAPLVVVPCSVSAFKTFNSFDSASLHCWLSPISETNKVFKSLSSLFRFSIAV